MSDEPRFLPDADWSQRSDLPTLLAALDAKHDMARYVGGAVRDTLLGLPVKDVDIATKLMPDAVMTRLDRAGIKAVPTGIDHGTITAMLPLGPVEITTLRRDVATDGRHATVSFGEDWRDDAQRRDFTMNALYVEPETGRIHDYFGGLDDLQRRAVRFIGDARQRIREDHLRILRYFRFFARFGSDPDPDALAACEAQRASLLGLSRERIAMELIALMATANPLPAVALMQRIGIWEQILPEIRSDAVATLKDLLRRESIAGYAGEPLVRLASLVPGEAEAVEKIAARLKFSRERTRILLGVAVGGSAEIPPAHALAYRHGPEIARGHILLHAPEERWAAELSSLEGWTVPRLPISGRHIIERGIEPGPKVSAVLQTIEKAWIAADFPNGTAFDALVDQAIARHSV